MKKRLLCFVVIVAMVLVTIGPVCHVNAENGTILPALENGKLYYEATSANLTGGATIAYGDWYGGIPGATQNMFVNNAGGNISMNIDVPYAGYYKIFITASTYNNSSNTYASVYVNGGDEKYIRALADEFCTWPEKGLSNYDDKVGGFVDVTGGFWLKAGSNTIDINYNIYGGWMLFDRLVLQIDSVALPEKDAAGVVYNSIAALPAEITADNYMDVLSLKEQYDALTNIQKIYVNNYSKLATAYEKAKAFTTQSYTIINDDGYTYQMEESVLEGAVIENTVEGFTGTGYVNTQAGKVTMKIDVPYDGYYKVYFSDSTYNSETDVYASVKVNEGDQYFVRAFHANYGRWTKEALNTYDYDAGAFEPYAGGLWFDKGANTVSVESQNGEWMLFDRMILVPDSLVYPEGDPVGAVANMIQAFPEEVTIADKAVVQEAKSAYDRLDAAGRVAVVNHSVLKNAFDAVVAVDVQPYTVGEGNLMYEAEYGLHTGKSFVSEDASASGGAHINIEWGTLYLNVEVPIAGNYHVSLFGSTDADDHNKTDYVKINEIETEYLTYYDSSSYGTWAESRIGIENYVGGVLSPAAPEDGIYLRKGSNLIVVRANWGNTNYDKLVLTPVSGHGSGDANGDGAVSVKDVVRMKRIMANVEGCPANFSADLDKNFLVEDVDLQKLRKRLALE